MITMIRMATTSAEPASLFRRAPGSPVIPSVLETISTLLVPPRVWLTLAAVLLWRGGARVQDDRAAGPRDAGGDLGEREIRRDPVATRDAAALVLDVVYRESDP